MGNHILINIFSFFLNMKLLILLIAIGVAQAFIVPAIAKTALNTGCKGVVTILCDCLEAEAKKNVAFIPKPLDLTSFIAKVKGTLKTSMNGTCDKLTSVLRNRRLMGLPGLSTITGVAGKLTGAAVKLVIAPIKASICTGLVVAIKSAAAAIGILVLPSCATDPIKKKCESMVDGMTKKITGRRTLLRRLNALSRQLDSF